MLYLLTARQSLRVQVGAKQITLTGDPEAKPLGPFELSDQETRRLRGSGVICTALAKPEPEPIVDPPAESEPKKPRRPIEGAA
jgi:hypothetical protein